MALGGSTAPVGELVAICAIGERAFNQLRYCVGSVGLTSASGQSSTSGSDDVFDEIAGHPHWIASSTGKPKPS